jgi:hypothetical protein
MLLIVLFRSPRYRLVRITGTAIAGWLALIGASSFNWAVFGNLFSDQRWVTFFAEFSVDPPAASTNLVFGAIVVTLLLIWRSREKEY